MPTAISLVGKIVHRDFTGYADILMESSIFQFFSIYWIPLLIMAYLAAVAEGMYRKVVDLVTLPTKAKFRLEPVRDSSENLVGIRLHNDEDVDITDKEAELIGFGWIDTNGEFLNNIDLIDHEKRILTWFESESFIGYRGHGLIRVCIIDKFGIHPCLKNTNINLHHSADEATLKFGVELRGKIGGKFMAPRQCCITFAIRKDILENNRIRWAIIQPTLEEGSCNWVKTISAEEFLAESKKRQGK